VASNAATDRNSNPIGVPTNRNVTVSRVDLSIAAPRQHKVLLIGEFSADCAGGTGGIVVASVLVDGNLRLNTQVNNQHADAGALLSVTSVLSVRPGKHNFQLQAFAANVAGVSAHHRSLTVVDLG
jgi:hypothetical protein